MENEFCSDCKRQTQIAVDHRSGDTICTECGLILEAHYIDTTSEWRHFADDDNTKDPNRVGDVAHNPMLSDNGSILTTRINTNNLNMNKKGHSNGDNPSTNLFRGAKTDQEHIKLSRMSNDLESMATRLGNVTKPILYSAQELYKRAHDKKCCKGRNSDAIMAACLYVACGQHGNKRTWKELAAVTNGSAKKKDIVQVKQLFEQRNVIEGGYETGPKYATPGELVRQCCNALGMDFLNRNAVEETLKNLEEFDIRRQPMSIMAAVVYMIVQLSNDKSTLKDVATSSRVAENTIKKTYGDVYPHASKVIPSRFNYDLKKLRAPTSA